MPIGGCLFAAISTLRLPFVFNFCITFNSKITFN